MSLPLDFLRPLQTAYLPDTCSISRLTETAGGNGTRRRGGRVDYAEILPHFREASWDEALGVVAAKLNAAKADRIGVIAGDLQDVLKVKDEVIESHAKNMELVKRAASEIESGEGGRYGGRFESKKAAADFGRAAIALARARDGATGTLQDLQKAGILSSQTGTDGEGWEDI